MWYVSSGRDEAPLRRTRIASTFAAIPSTRRSGRAAGTSASGTALARLELRVLFEETLARYPNMELAGEPTWVVSTFVNQLKTLPVRLGPASSAGR